MTPHPGLRYLGGKWRIAPLIVAHLPPHECYVEPFAGGASVLLRKLPAEFECLNDLDGDVVAFWRVLRERPHELIAQILLTPYSRAELRQANDHPADLPDLERARRLWLRCYQGRGSSSRNSGWRFQPTNVFSNGQTWHVHHARAARRIHGLVDIAVRLHDVQIEHDTAETVIARWDRPGTLFYIDPPYADGRDPNLYTHEMGSADHERLALVLRGIRGMAVVSGAPGLYDRLLEGWRRIENAARGESQKARIECLWLNPAADRALSPDQPASSIPT